MILTFTQLKHIYSVTVKGTLDKCIFLLNHQDSFTPRMIFMHSAMLDGSSMLPFWDKVNDNLRITDDLLLI